MDIIDIQSKEVVITFNTIQKVDYPFLNNELTIDRNTRCVFVLNISDLINIIPFLTNLLNELEIKKSKKYYRLKDQQQFIVSKGILKVLLGKYLNIKPDKICFELSKNNKPILSGNRNLMFNVSHTEGLTFIAIHNQRLGIDIERLNFEFNYTEILSSSFSRQEIEYIEKSDVSSLLFYKLWTRKEALIKGTSLGINDDFKNIPSLDGRQLINSQTIESNEDWTVDSYSLNNEYICSLAYHSNHSAKVFFQKVDENLII